MANAVKTRRISPSQLEAYHRCNRRWAFEYRAGRREGFSAAAQAGTETHKVLEDQGPWDKTWTSPEGKEYDVGAMAALLHAQTPEGVVAREQRFEVELDGVPFVGVTDFYSEDLVGDFKTTSNKRNAKTIGGKDESKDLILDPQRLLYTRFVPSARRMIWLYGAWADMSVTKREVPVDVEADKERFKLRVLQPAEVMLATPDSVDPLSLKPNVKACSLFPPKGCPFKDDCFPPGRLAPVVTSSKEGRDQMSSLLERLKNKNAAPAAPAAPAAEKPVDMPVVMSTTHGVTEPTDATAFALPLADAFVLYEPAAATPAAPAAEPAKRRPGRPRKTETPAPEPVSVPVPAEMAPAIAAAREAEWRLAQPNSATQSTPAKDYRFPYVPPTDEQPNSVAQPPTSQYIVGTLYIDCLPLGESFVLASASINAAAEMVANDFQVPHYGLVEFGKGGPALAAQLRHSLSGRYIDAMYLETKTPEGKACLNVLVSVAQRVVRGVF